MWAKNIQMLQKCSRLLIILYSTGVDCKNYIPAQISLLATYSLLASTSTLWGVVALNRMLFFPFKIKCFCMKLERERKMRSGS